MPQFGKGNYFLYKIQDVKTGKKYLRSDLSGSKQKHDLFCKLLSQTNPAAKIKYRCKQLVYRAAISYDDFLLQFDFVLPQFKHKEYIKTFKLDFRKIEARDYFIVNLNEHFRVGLNKLVDSSDNVIAVLSCNNEGYEIWTEYPIYLSGAENTVKVFSNNSVRIAGNTHVFELLRIIAKNIFIEEDAKISFKSGSLDLLCGQICQLNGKMNLGTMRVNAGFFNNNAHIKAETAIHIITEQGQQNGSLHAKQMISALSLLWQESKTSCMHTAGTLHLLSINHQNQGDLSANHFILEAFNSTISGRITSAQNTYLHTDQTMITTKNSSFLLNGKVNIDSHIRELIEGNIYYHPDLKVEWQLITDPTLHPKFPMSSKISSHPADHCYEVMLRANILLEMKGVTYIKNAAFNISSSRILMTGKIYHESDFEQYNISLDAYNLLLAGSIKTNANLQAKLKNNLKLKGSLDAKNIVIMAEDIMLASSANVSSETIQAKADNNIVFMKNTEIKANNKITLNAKNITSRGLLRSPFILLNAERLIFMCGSTESDVLKLSAPIIISKQNLHVKELSVTSIMAVLVGMTWADIIAVNSVVNFSPMLTVQSGLRFPDKLSALTAAINITLSVIGTLIPGAIAVTLPTSLVMNGFIRSASIVKSAENVLKSIEIAFRHSSKDDTLKSIVAINNFFTLLISSGLVVWSGANSFSEKSKNTINHSFETSDLLAAGQQVAANVFTMLGGCVDNALLSVKPGAFLGYSNSENHLISLEFGPRIELSSTNYNALSLNSEYYAALGPIASSSYYQVLAGQSFSPFGHSIIAKQLYVSPIIPDISSYNLYVQAQNIDIYRSTSVNHGAFRGNITVQENAIFTPTECLLAGTEFKNDGISVFLNCDKNFMLSTNSNQEQLILSRENIETVLVKAGGIRILDGSVVHTKTLNIEPKASQESRVSNVSIDILNNTGKFSSFGGHLKITELNNKGEYINYQQYSNIKECNNTGTIYVRESDTTIQKLKNKGKYTLDRTILNTKYVVNLGTAFDPQHKNLYGTLPNYFDLHRNQSRHRKLPPIPEWHTTIQDGMVTHIANQSTILNHLFINTLVPIRFSAPNLVIKNSICSTSGLALQATQEQVQGIGAQCIAVGDIIISGEKGVDLRPKIKKVEKEDTHWQWHGLSSGIESSKEIYDEIESPSVIVSQDGKITVSTVHGSIHLSGTATNAPLGIFYDAKDGSFTIEGAKLIFTKEFQHFGLTGFANSNQYVEGTYSSVIDSDDIVSICSSLQIDVNDTVIKTKYIKLKAPYVNFSRTINNNSINVISCYLSFNTFIYNVEFDPFVFVPFYFNVKQFIQSDNSISSAASAIKLSMNAANRSNELMNSMRTTHVSMAQAASSIVLNDMISSLLNIQLSLNLNHNSWHYQTLNNCIVEANELTIEANDGGFHNDVTLKVEHMNIKAKKFEISGAELQSDYSSSSIGLGSVIGINGIGSPVVSYQNQSNSQITHQTAKPQIKHLNVEVNDFTLKNSEVKPDTMTGSILNLILETDKDTQRSSYNSFYAGLNNNFGIAMGEQFIDSISEKSHLEARDQSTLPVNHITSVNAGLAAPVEKKHTFSCSFSYSNPLDVFNSIDFSFGNSHYNYSLTTPIINSQGMHKLKQNLQWITSSPEDFHFQLSNHNEIKSVTRHRLLHRVHHHDTNMEPSELKQKDINKALIEYEVRNPTIMEKAHQAFECYHFIDTIIKNKSSVYCFLKYPLITTPLTIFSMTAAGYSLSFIDDHLNGSEMPTVFLLESLGSTRTTLNYSNYLVKTTEKIGEITKHSKSYMPFISPVVSTKAIHWLDWKSTALGATGVSLLIYDVATAKNKTAELLHQIGIFSAGTVGGVLFSLGASPLCGPAAPICFSSSVLIGRIAGAYVGDILWKEITNNPQQQGLYNNKNYHPTLFKAAKTSESDADLDLSWINPSVL